MADSLWGEEFTVQETPEVTKSILKKISEPKSARVVKEKVTKSKKVPLEDKLKLITAKVYEILGKYKEDTLVIKTKEELVEYIDKAIENGIIAVDTETNNSLEPVTCKLMGPCIYTPGLKNAYIPINHIDCTTFKRLEWQLTEADIAEQFARLNDTKIIMHNGKFDYQVIKCTCGLPLKIYWDTMIGARILNENERSAGLKQQYISKIDPNQEKYSIDHLFEDIEYAVVDPDVFALYAATDSYMTYKLYKYQLNEFSKPDNSRLLKLLLDVEMPVVEVAAEMELTGVVIDKEYSAVLSKKYHKQLDEVQSKIQAELDSYKDAIAKWRLTDEANYHSPKIDKTTKKQKLNAKTGQPEFNKSLSEQLDENINTSSPTQLAILLYDVLKIPAPDAETPRSTRESVLEQIDLPICKYILEQRGLDKLIGTYIDKLPACVTEKTGRLHAHFNQLGTDTGRFSSSDPNLQNIPSHNKEIRMMFAPGVDIENIEFEDSVTLEKCWQVRTAKGYTDAEKLHINDRVYLDDDSDEYVTIINITEVNDMLLIQFREDGDNI